ncbi:hypothetical protein K1T71_001414 [Dendrolimus kikuchii]|uniref:Uncharacterized protein n=1 Tax=Dendrolimus kikuchii TaxID=765133 RepID=A0ACC1DHI9_9NEOP|nr:hypothetical protein K1T71_001414 [Dendrolimus kikuchii]
MPGTDRYSSDVADKAGLHDETVSMRATSAWDSGELECTTEIIKFCVSNSENKRFKLIARKIKELDLSCNDTHLHELIRRSFSLDSIGINNKPRQNINDLRAIKIMDESAELINGYWTISLPWKDDFFVMPDSYPTALKRLQSKSIERKMLSDPEYESRYRERIKHLLDNNYAKRLSNTEIRENASHTWYLPHFGVDNPNKKKRLVFDGASKRCFFR